MFKILFVNVSIKRVIIMKEQNKKNVLGSRIMQRRKQCGIKQSELAEAIGVSDNQISNIENGKSFPRLNSFLKICEILDCNSDYFLSGIVKNNVQENIIDLISVCTIEEQKVIWKLIDCYVHRSDDDRF